MNVVPVVNVCFQLISNPLCVTLDDGELRVHLVLNGGDVIARSQYNVTDGQWYSLHMLMTNNELTVEGTLWFPRYTC